MCKEHGLWVNVQSDELGSEIFTLVLPVGHAVREGIVEPRIDEEIPKARMVYPMDKSGEISRHMIALG